MDTGKTSFSAHAMKRAQQRGVRPATIEFKLGHADVDLHAGDGCRTYRISKRGSAKLLRTGANVIEVDKASNIVVIVREDSGEVITVLHDFNQDGRKYRRQWPTWKSKRSSVAA
jgi:molybdopterin-guanine dinucleotide biosynthesis protein